MADFSSKIRFFSLVISALVLGYAVVNSVQQDQDNEEEFKPDENLLNWTAPAELEQLYPYFVAGVDKEGSPICIIPSGSWDYRETLEKGSQAVKDFDIYTAQIIERCYSGSRLVENATQNDVLIIADMDGYNARQFFHFPTVNKFISMARQLIEVQRRGGHLKQGIIVNANYFFQTVWNLLTPVLGETGNTLKVYGTNPSTWKPILLKLVHKDQLPEKLGGSANFQPVKVYG